ncbi:PUB domain,Pyrrolo-quinoline quinone beta-propeller repeat,Protein kinase domain,Serine/threonine- [Cinara cedri]|uniref:non-specific serine/threonine protein kinase n=1 Tax=Cinara cedri TaxID=506608 RepID=A0A5E4MMZ5_9HEMI|nr:PUB domain,Pyrrolo-quinoline quinone beta-propeller repeat,Protein kinase domain,Serine/threonine- [Cinara cedri]
MHTPLVLLIIGLIYVNSQDNPIHEKEDKSLAKISLVQYEGIIFLNTLDGSFIAVDQRTGKTLWNFHDDPPVKVPSNIKDALTPLFLPDPRDGSLYLLHNKDKVGIKKLDVTIPQLVANSPCRSSDGILFSGKKIDSWYFIDWNTGERHPFMNFEKQGEVCTAIASKSILLSKSEYSVMMVDSLNNNQRQWNVTFYTYNSKTMTEEQIYNHGLNYFAASSSGNFAVFLNEKSSPPINYNNLLWEREFDSPVIGVYQHDGESLLSLPLTSIAKDSIKHLISNIALSPKDPNSVSYFHTLYIGHHIDTGLYALPAIADTGEVNPLVDRGLIVLLDKTSFSVLPYYSGNEYNVEPKNVENHTILLGHYQLNQELNTGTPRITGNTDSIIYYHNMSGYNYSNKQTSTISTQTPQFLDSWFIVQMFGENAGIKLFMVWITLLMSFMFWYLRKEMKGLQKKPINSYNSSQGSSRGSNHSSSSSSQIVEELHDGSFSIGKIMFRTDEILGKGCEGTFVFRGEFECRPVAVKRLLPECFIAGEREVHILRESDYHPNVVRYYCTEQDKQFRYIALELCAATLEDYVEKNQLRHEISPKEILSQSIKGLQHLHSLGIVHRDIKPHNVLLSIPSRGNGSFSSVRALISDFGLCKKLQGGKMSFSKRSGVTGTDGWIAPEMFANNASVTKSIDIFSMGCLFYYILSDGKHPFGESLWRQAKILDKRQVPCLDALNDNEVWKRLISVMISRNPEDRPTASAVRYYPAFWDSSTLLSFLQDVSDRVEKELSTSPVMLELEKGGDGVFGRDGWHDQIDPVITSELRKYRTYRTDSIRDLLRAFRNKKHHFRELSLDTQKLLGDIPDTFLEYWTTRFPLLVYHTWTSMQCLSNEITFVKYFTNCYKFPRTEFSNIPTWVFDQPFSSLQKSAIRRPNTGTSWRHKKRGKTVETLETSEH